MSVFVLDRRKKPLMPCSEKRARLLLSRGRAVVHRRFPFAIRLKHRSGGAVQPLRLKLDPGAAVTGVALVREAENGVQHVLHLAQIAHKGKLVGRRMRQRAMYRRRRRSANLRYRPARFDNRTKPKGWLPPSLRSRLDNSASWAARYRRLCPLSVLSVEHVRFDMQAMQSPGISGVEYQQGELAGYEVREYLLEKWGRQCAYCGAEGCPLQVEHIVARASGGSDRVSNLTLACAPCNQRKGAQPVEAFLRGRPEVLRRVLAHAQRPLAAAAAVNATRWALVARLRATALPVELASGGRTKWNRARFGIPKSHSLDAACVGEVEAVLGWQQPAQRIACTGRGGYQRAQVDAFGFPRGARLRVKRVHGFQTGDMVQAVLAKGVHAGTWVGRVAIRASGSFNLQTATGLRQSIGWKHCRLLQRGDGYSYSTAGKPGGASSPCLERSSASSGKAGVSIREAR